MLRPVTERYSVRPKRRPSRAVLDSWGYCSTHYRLFVIVRQVASNCGARPRRRSEPDTPCPELARGPRQSPEPPVACSGIAQRCACRARRNAPVELLVYPWSSPADMISAALRWACSSKVIWNNRTIPSCPHAGHGESGVGRWCSDLRCSFCNSLIARIFAGAAT